MEVFKYAVKFSDLTLADNWHAAQILKGKRLLNSFGSFRGVDIPDSLLDEPLDGLRTWIGSIATWTIPISRQVFATDPGSIAFLLPG